MLNNNSNNNLKALLLLSHRIEQLPEPSLVCNQHSPEGRTDITCELPVPIKCHPPPLTIVVSLTAPLLL